MPWKLLGVLIIVSFFLQDCKQGRTDPHNGQGKLVSRNEKDSTPVKTDTLGLDTSLYNKMQMLLVQGKPGVKWPVKGPYPLNGAILPFKRVVAFYGNLYSANMGILGELTPAKMLAKLQEETAKWTKADSSMPAIPALHYIAVTAQGSKGSGSKYRLRMPFQQIDKVLRLADSIGAIVFLDIQVGHSTLQDEIPELDKYLKMPNVHLGIDAEYSMKNGKVPSSSIGTFDASDVNFASEHLAKIVKDNKLPPKILVVHRFTNGMITNYQQIVTRPEVQIVMNMDGFGSPAKKLDSYKGWITNQPVQFTGFKLFYKQDTHMMEPAEVLKLYPRPVYIQYQ